MRLIRWLKTTDETTSAPLQEVSAVGILTEQTKKRERERERERVRWKELLNSHCNNSPVFDNPIFR